MKKAPFDTIYGLFNCVPLEKLFGLLNEDCNCKKISKYSNYKTDEKQQFPHKFYIFDFETKTGKIWDFIANNIRIFIEEKDNRLDSRLSFVGFYTKVFDDKTFSEIKSSFSKYIDKMNDENSFFVQLYGYEILKKDSNTRKGIIVSLYDEGNFPIDFTKIDENEIEELTTTEKEKISKELGIQVKS
ncbi:hypothetical protein [Treponema berlinense]|uniref:hypothetical protein n=1 Tax=Treponema berlinense TaxID=225004 RepID=UPI00235407D9|nr:hypothetical protein [Treponema berlinense]